MSQYELEVFGPPGHFFEGPRWHDGRWWVSDMRGRVVYSIARRRFREEVRLQDDDPSGLGWLPDGTLILVSMNRRQLLCRSPGGGEAKLYADLAPLCGDAEGYINDMGVSADGHAYVGFDTAFRTEGPGADGGLLIHVDPRGIGQVAARGLYFPNGVVFTPDGSTLVVAETAKPPASAAIRSPRTAAWAASSPGPASTPRSTSGRTAAARWARRRPTSTAATWTRRTTSGRRTCVARPYGSRPAATSWMRSSCPTTCAPGACALGGEDGRTQRSAARTWPTPRGWRPRRPASTSPASRRPARAGPRPIEAQLIEKPPSTGRATP